MNRKGKKSFVKRLVACTLAFSMALATGTACGKQESHGKISVIVRSTGADYWEYCKQGAMDAGSELRYDVTYEAPMTEAEDNVQVDLIKKAITDKVDALVISPLDTVNVANALKEVQQAGIPIIMINNEADSSFETEGRKICIATNTPAGGSIAARQAKNITGSVGDIEILAHTSDPSVDNGRLTGFMEELASNEDDEDDKDKSGTETAAADDNALKIVNVDYCNSDSETAYQKTLEAIEKYDNLSLIYATNENTSVGACKAIAEKKLEHQINVIGFDSSSTQIQYLMDGVLDGMIVQNPYNMGYLGVRYAHQVLEGKEIPDSIDTGVTYVNGENYSQPGVQLVLDPVNYIKNQVNADNSEEGK